MSLTYEDVTNIDSVGLVTARSGLRVVGGGLTVTGVSTFHSNIFVGRPGTSEDQVSLYDNTFLRFGDSNDFFIMHDGTDAITKMREDGGRLRISANPLEFQINDVSIATIAGAGITVGGGITATGSIQVGSGQSFGSSGASAAVYYGDGSNLTNLPAAGITTEALVSSGIVTTLNLTAAQDHKVTASGITTITVSGGTEAESHTVRIINSGITTVGFSTFFLFPSGSTPSLPTAEWSN